jgi:L-alanine-DL-glutamate epimerase-like enolase superfamily enzyme
MSMRPVTDSRTQSAARRGPDATGRRRFFSQALAGVVGGGALLQSNVDAASLFSPLPVPPAGRIVVERIESFKVAVPMKPGSVNSEELGDLIDPVLATFDQVPKHIIRLHADNGMIGLGETGRGEDLGEAVSANAAFLKGRNILELNFADPTLGLPQARTADAFEIAIYDLIGKTLGVPIHVLLGGRFQDNVAVTYWTGQRTNDDLVEVAQRAVELGFTRLKFKARRKDPIVQRVHAVHKAVPQLALTVDFNQSYPNPAEFIPVARQMVDTNLMIEDPFPKRVEWFRELKDTVKIPLALTPGGVPAMMEAIRAQACDVFNLGGNMRHFVKVCYLAEAAGIEVWHGSGVELGIRDMSFLQAAAATRSCTVPSDTLSFFLRSSDLLATPVPVVKGYVAIPRTPGLGVELDLDKVRHYQVA